MALSDFWRSNRGRNRDEGRQGERDWQSEHESRYENRADEGEGFRRRGGWREGSDYYGNNPERYEADCYGGQDYLGGEQSYRDWRTGRGGSEESDHGREGRGSSFNDRWQNSYSSSSSARPFRGYGGYGGGNYSESGTYGGYGRPRFGSRVESRSQQFGESDIGQGQFRGRGPKGYRRSDDRIREDVCECLTEDDRIDASSIDVTVKECEVTLIGTVNSRAEKRRAEDLIERLPGVKDVHNQLRIESESTQDRTTSGSSGDGGNQSRQDVHH